MPPAPPPFPVAAKPKREIFDPWNSSSTGHQRAENRLSGSTSWRDSRTAKLSEQFRAGLSGGKRIADTVGAGSESFERGERTANGGWKRGVVRDRASGQVSLWESFGVGNGKRSNEGDATDSSERRLKRSKSERCEEAKGSPRARGTQEERGRIAFRDTEPAQRQGDSDDFDDALLASFSPMSYVSFSSPEARRDAVQKSKQSNGRECSPVDGLDMPQKASRPGQCETKGDAYRGLYKVNVATTARGCSPIPGSDQPHKKRLISPSPRTCDPDPTDFEGSRSPYAPSPLKEPSPSPPDHRPTQARPSSPAQPPPLPPQIFANLTIYINGSTYPVISDHKLKHLLATHGASLSTHLGRRSVTHVILGLPSKATRDAYASTPNVAGRGAGGALASGKIQKEIMRVKSAGGKGVRYVSAEWVLECVKKGKRVAEGAFEVVQTGGAGQRGVGRMLGGG
ncbi:DNA repair protein REV1 [Sphaceloma murrayae]|uniref:DNA repair protein REV1 n=1 Tax=Sphaceloma murrayae TaxID=2082308 RepID=A0A2K1QMA1_9PEZI|nr:DNA repair protein REV1 [Sphaceloma murrayae]